MALYTKPVNSPRIAGSRKGATFTRTPNGFIIRKRYMPKSSRNAKTTAIRAKFLTSVQRLRSLDPSNKQTFVNEAPNFERTNSLGQTYTLKPSQLATSQTFNRLENNEPPPLTAAHKETIQLAQLAGSGWNVNPPLLQLLFNPDPVPVGHSLIVYLSKAGSFAFPHLPVSELRQVLVLNEGEGGIIDMLPYWQNVFGVPSWKAQQTMIVGSELYKHGSGQKSELATTIIGAV